jgi:2-oxoglutarate dehydrogenase complex dehydrogenase (E1) component-like enzyme
MINSMTTEQTNQESVHAAQGRASRIMTIIRSYMSSGHFKADLDPLKLRQAYKDYGSKVRTETFDSDLYN